MKKNHDISKSREKMKVVIKRKFIILLWTNIK